jgi:alkanesulfonate monooxygenase SsuD/methylene tetrahydromethanopterin reductase-like flavin-dependent oxidoreductase (luciferase family)
MPTGGIEFGAYFPQLQFGFDEIVERVQTAERCGFGSVWFYDHLYPPGLPGVPGFEAWTLISALAPLATRIRLGHLVLCNQRKAALGLEHFVFFFHDRGARETLELFASEVAPAFA